MVGGINSSTWQQHAWQNRLQSVLLLLFMGGFLALLGWIIWGADGVFMLLLMGVILVLFNPRLAPNMVMRLYGATQILPRQSPRLYAILEELSTRAELQSLPTLYYVPSNIINAFTVGRDPQAAIAITHGMLRELTLREQVGVLAHEISHIRNDDTWVMGLADTFSRMTSVLSLFGMLLLILNIPLLLVAQVSLPWLAIIVLILAPTLSALAQLGLSRTREFDADLNAVRLTADPQGLAQALMKIERLQGNWLTKVLLPGRGMPEPSLLRTHPPTEQRVQRLQQLQQTKHKAIWDSEMLVDEWLQARRVSRSPYWRLSGIWY